MMRRTVLWGGLVAATVVAVVVAVVWFALGSSVDERVGGAAAESVPVAGADLTGSGPGSLVSAMTMPGFLREVHTDRVQAARVVYRSTSEDGQPTVVSGSVFVPEGGPPGGGWPVIAYGHGTTGIDEPCAPSLSDSLLGSAQVVAALITKGYAVAFADYQGLGTPGVHPYTDSRTAGRNMIDAVRALRATFKDVSNRWGAYGGSQGGGAAWAAAEQARTYAPELDLVGAVAISPAADVTGLVDKAQQGTLTIDQDAALSMIIESLARLHPDINRDDYRHGAAARNWDAIVACSGPEMPGRSQAIKDDRTARRSSQHTGGRRSAAALPCPVGAAATTIIGAASRVVWRDRHIHRRTVDRRRDTASRRTRRTGGGAVRTGQGPR